MKRRNSKMKSMGRHPKKRNSQKRVPGQHGSKARAEALALINQLMLVERHNVHMYNAGLFVAGYRDAYPSNRKKLRKDKVWSNLTYAQYLEGQLMSDHTNRLFAIDRAERLDAENDIMRVQIARLKHELLKRMLDGSRRSK